MRKKISVISRLQLKLANQSNQTSDNTDVNGAGNENKMIIL